MRLDLVILVGPFLLSIFYDSMNTLNSVESFLNLTCEENFPIKFIPYIVRKEKYSRSSSINETYRWRSGEMGKRAQDPPRCAALG